MLYTVKLSCMLSSFLVLLSPSLCLQVAMTVAASCCSPCHCHRFQAQKPMDMLFSKLSHPSFVPTGGTVVLLLPSVVFLIFTEGANGGNA